MWPRCSGSPRPFHHLITQTPSFIDPALKVNVTVGTRPRQPVGAAHGAARQARRGDTPVPRPGPPPRKFRLDPASMTPCAPVRESQTLCAQRWGPKRPLRETASTVQDGGARGGVLEWTLRDPPESSPCVSSPLHGCAVVGGALPCSASPSSRAPRSELAERPPQAPGPDPDVHRSTTSSKLPELPSPRTSSFTGTDFCRGSTGVSLEVSLLSAALGPQASPLAT